MLSEVVFAKGMTFLSIALKEKNLEKSTLDVYYELLKHMSDKSFEQSIKTVAQTRQFSGLPTPAEILKHDITKDELFDDVPALADAMYKKFYAQNAGMLDFCRANRNKIPSDREFFKYTNYKALKNVLGEKVYTEKELYVLKKLGGGEFLLSIKDYATSTAVIDKIEAIIRGVITRKYLTVNSGNALESSRVKALLENRI